MDEFQFSINNEFDNSRVTNYLTKAKRKTIYSNENNLDKYQQDKLKKAIIDLKYLK